MRLLQPLNVHPNGTLGRIHAELLRLFLLLLLLFVVIVLLPIIVVIVVAIIAR
jgi:hypothetical protein